jgi:PAS domain S-box-containing protein
MGNYKRQRFTMSPKSARPLGSIFVYAFAVFLVSAGLMALVEPALSAPILPVALLVGLSTAVIYVLNLRELLASDRKFRGLISSVDDVILILDSDGLYREVIPTSPKFLYKSLEQLSGKLMHEVLPKEDADFFLDRIRLVLERNRTERVEYCLPIGGETVWFEAAVSPLTDTEVIWVARDITARHQAEEMLQRSQAVLEDAVNERTRELSEAHELYRSTIDQASDIIFSVDFEGTLTSINPAFERILGYQRTSWIGRRLDELMSPLDRPSLETLLSESRDGAARLRVIDREGRDVRLELTLVDHVLRGEKSGYLGVARDVTAREEAEEELRRGRNLLSEAQRIARVGSWDANVRTGEVWWSDELCRILEIERDRTPLSYELFESMIVPEDLEQHREAMKGIGPGGAIECEVRIEPSDGHRKTVHLIVSSKGEGRITGTVQDVTEARVAERRLRESEARFQWLGRATNDVIWDWDLTSDELWWGEGIYRQFGYAPGQVENHISSWKKQIHPEDRDRVLAHIKEVIDSDESLYSDEYRFMTATGTFASVLDRAYVIRNVEGRAFRMVGAMIDFTERKNLEARLEQEKRVSSLGHLAASIAHEVNNVLMGIQPNIELIRRQSSGRFDSTIENIVTAVRRGKRVTETILSYTRSSDPSLESFEVGPFIRSWIEELRPSLGSAIGLEVSFGSEDLYMKADRMQMGQVLANLSTNACDAMSSEGGMLTIHVEPASAADSVLFDLPDDHDRYIHISVSDTGAGIPSQNLKLIFDPFFTTRQRGTGLGLAITRQIVQVHGGRIVAESELGKGTTFHLFIPQGVPTVRTIASGAVERPTRLQRVVVVEDEEAVAAGLSSLFELEGIAVEHVMLGSETFDAIERFRPDVVILDVGLPDMDGSEVFLEISRRWPGLPVVFSSGHADVLKLKPYVSQPHVEFIQKPYDFGVLMQRIGRALESTCGV